MTPAADPPLPPSGVPLPAVPPATDPAVRAERDAVRFRGGSWTRWHLGGRLALWLAVLALLLLGLVLPAAAQGRMVALVFGNDRYSAIRPLDNAGADAQAVAATLRQMGFEVSLELDRDLRRMRRALEDFREDGQGAEVALIFYAGHGVEIAGRNRLLPSDTSVESLAALEASSLPLDELRAAATATAPVALILLDACRDDPFATAAGAGASRGGVRLPKEIEQAARPGLGRMGEARNTLFAFAAAPGETASDGAGGNSPFTQALTRYLGTDGLEIRSVLTLVQQEVYDRTGGAQLPYVENGLPAMFFAGTDGGALPERERLLLAMAQVTPELRAEVERIAAAQDVPLAPLYGALIAAGLGQVGLEQRTAELTEAARAFTETRERLRALSAADPEVARLRAEAEAQLALGALAAATAALDQAVALDRASVGNLKQNLIARSVSAAASLAAKAGVARTGLDYAGAVAALTEAAALHDEIAALSIEEDAEFQRETILGELAQVQKVSGDIGAALATTRRMLAAAEARFAATGTVEAERAVSVALDRLGDIYYTTGDIERSLDAVIRSLDMALALAERNPGLRIPQRDLAVSYIRLGDLRLETGAVEQAVEAYTRSRDIALELSAQVPEDTEYLRDSQIGHVRLGDALQAANRLDEARASYEAGLAVAQRLAAAEPASRERRRDLGIAWGKIAEISVRTRDYPGALAAATEARALAQALIAEDPLDTRFIRDGIVTLMTLGDVQAGMQDYPAALATFRLGQAAMQALRDRDPGNTGWLRDLAVGLGRVGDMQAMTADFPGARATHEQALGIYYRLAAIDPSSMNAQRDLIIGHFKLSFVAEDQRVHLAAALAVAQALAARGALAPADSFMIDYLRGRLAELGTP